MSIKLMTKVWEHGPEDRTETMVLLALADRANDDGSSCFPSVKEVSQRSRLSRRGTQKVIRRLEHKGFLTVDENGGPGGTNNYQLHPARFKGRTECTGEGEHHSPGGELDDEKGRSTFARNRQEPPDNRQESARVREDDPPGVRVWVDVTGERPNIQTRQMLRDELTAEDGPLWDEHVFRDVLKEAWLNVGKDADRIRIGYLLTSYEQALARAASGDGAPTSDPDPTTNQRFPTYN